jgi:hypothetical protein
MRPPSKARYGLWVPIPTREIDTGGTMGSADLKEGAVKGAMTTQSGNAAQLLRNDTTGVVGIKDS